LRRSHHRDYSRLAANDGDCFTVNRPAGWHAGR
jgi:hypothetical protein